MAMLCAIGALPVASQAAQIKMKVTQGATVVCDNVTEGVVPCIFAAGGGSITVTWSLDAPTTLNGYDLNVNWDPSELTLFSSDQLFPDSSPPDTIPFLIEPNPADPAGSAAAVLSLVSFQTTALFRATFLLPAASSLPVDCLVDVSWNPNGNGLSPGSVDLTNEDGASVDLGVVTHCSDGLDNEGDGLIDADGGQCAGVATPTLPDPQCTSFTGATEAAPPPAGNNCGIGFELAVLLPLLRAARRARRSA